MTLVEVLVTLTLIGTVLLALGALFAESFGTVRKSRAESVAIFIAENVHARLMTDAAWPPGATSGAFSREVDEHGVPVDTFVFDQLFFDDEGTEVGVDEDHLHTYQGILTFSRSANYQSRRLDFIVLDVVPLFRRDEPITFSFQRANRTQRPAPSP